MGRRVRSDVAVFGAFSRSKKLVVDLCGVIHMDSEARRLLAEIHKRTGADLLADTPMTKYFADGSAAPKQKRIEEE